MNIQSSAQNPWTSLSLVQIRATRHTVASAKVPAYTTMNFRWMEVIPASKFVVSPGGAGITGMVLRSIDDVFEKAGASTKGKEDMERVTEKYQEVNRRVRGRR